MPDSSLYPLKTWHTEVAETGKLNPVLSFTEEEVEASNMTVLFWEIPTIDNGTLLNPMLEVLMSQKQRWMTQALVL